MQNLLMEMNTVLLRKKRHLTYELWTLKNTFSTLVIILCDVWSKIVWLCFAYLFGDNQTYSSTFGY